MGGILHLVGLPHTGFDKDRYSNCAFTAKSVRLVQMLDSVGFPSIVYWGGAQPYHYEGRFVSLMHETEQEQYFGAYDRTALPVVEWDRELPYWQDFNSRAIENIEARIQPGDIIGLVCGSINQPVADHFSGDYVVAEVGVGYEGLCTGTVACFESYAWMHNRYGAMGIGDGRDFDAVIPNAVDPDDFTVGSDEGYLLFMGRFIQRKAPHVAAQIAKEVGLPLKIAGTGVVESSPGRLLGADGVLIEDDNVEYIGSLNPVQRRSVLSHASALIVPTRYIGPWEGVHAEAMMSGVLPVTTDFGAFTETVPQQYRFRSLREASVATDRAINDRGRAWRDYANGQFGIQACAKKYERWLNNLLTLYGAGWYTR